MKKYILLLLVLMGVASCSSLQDLQLDVETRTFPNTCVRYNWNFNLYQDCYTGQFLLRPPYYYNNFLNNRFYGPRLIIRSTPARRTTTRVKGRRTSTPRSTPRGTGGGTKLVNAQ